MAVVGFHRLEELFRKGAGLDIKKGHVKDITDIVEQKLYDLLLMGQVTASYNGRDIIYKYDVPITKGLEETIDEFKKLEQEIRVEDIVEALTHYPSLVEMEIELEKELPNITGGLLLALAKVMKAIEGGRAVNHEMIEEAKNILNITL